jgi:sugar O-acyltransferase (sialic acid O-acetyltransferase NeuD family)
MTAATKLILVGGGGTSADVLTIVAAINTIAYRYEILGLVDDALPAGSFRWGVPVLGGLGNSVDTDVTFVDCLGSPRNFRGRETLYGKLGFDLGRFETLVHPAAIVSSDARIGAGSILYPGTVVLSGVKIGAHVTILAGCVLNHEVQVGDWSILASGALLSGTVCVGRSCYIGVGSSVREGTAIGDGALVAMGSVVTRDVEPGETVGGVPARPLRSQV